MINLFNYINSKYINNIIIYLAMEIITISSLIKYISNECYVVFK